MKKDEVKVGSICPDCKGKGRIEVFKGIDYGPTGEIYYCECPAGERAAAEDGPEEEQ